MRLYLFQMALMPTNGIPAPSYLIQTDDGANVLIDTGFSKHFEAPSMDLRLAVDLGTLGAGARREHGCCMLRWSNNANAEPLWL